MKKLEFKVVRVDFLKEIHKLDVVFIQKADY